MNMKKSINIGIILFLLLQACTSEENSLENTPQEPISEDTPINEPLPENENNSSKNVENDNNQPPEDIKPVGNQELIDEALSILENPTDDVVKCIDNDVYGLYDQVQDGYEPDDYESQVVVNCFNNPDYYGPIDGTNSSPPPEGENNSQDEEGNNPPPSSDEGSYEDYDNFYA